MSIHQIKLRNRKIMKKSLKKFGESLTIVSNEVKTKGVGLFNSIENEAHVGLLNENLGACFNQKFSLWLYNYTPLQSIDYVIKSNNENFEVITGFYDDNIGCWRLIVQKCA